MKDEIEQELICQTALVIAKVMSQASSTTGRLFWADVLKEALRILEIGEP